MAYSKKTWVDDEVITKEALNNIETGIENTEKAIPSTATKTKAGTVKQAAMVEFKALLDSLKTSGIMASS